MRKKRMGRPPKDASERRRTYNYRLTPKMKAMIVWLSALEGQTETGFIESGCNMRAAQIEKKRGIDFDDVYHSNDGVMWLRTFLIKAYPLTKLQEQIRDFVFQHMAFFYSEHGEELIVRTLSAEVLWPQMDRFMKLSKTDYAKASEAMAEALRARGIEPPTS